MDRARVERMAQALDSARDRRARSRAPRRAPARARRRRSPARGGTARRADRLHRRRAAAPACVELDRRGHLVAAFRWREDGGLGWAKCRSRARRLDRRRAGRRARRRLGRIRRGLAPRPRRGLGAPRAPHRLRGGGLGASRADPAARRAAAPAAGRGHRGAQPRRRPHEGSGTGARALSRPLSE